MLRVLALAGALALLAAGAAQAKAPPYWSKVAPLSAAQQKQLKRSGFWRPVCPVPLHDLRLLTVAHWDFAGRRRLGQLVVNADVAGPLRVVFRRLYRLRFPIKHMRFVQVYGPRSAWPKDGDASAVFDCRQAVPSPCSGKSGTGTWSEHAYGHAIDLNPIENPYVGLTCGGRVHTPASRRFADRTRLRKGMVTPAVVEAFRSIGWGWGGWWSTTKDYMHFSTSGH